MEKIKSILHQFQIPKIEYNLEVISNGFINDTYLVLNENEPIYIFQKINTAIFTNIDSLIYNLDLVLPLLTSTDYAEVRLVQSEKGKSFIKTKSNHVYRLMTFIKNSVVYNTTTNPTIAYEAGRIVGLFHQLLIDFDSKVLKDTLPKFHDVSFRYQQFKEAYANAKKEHIKIAQSAISFVNTNINTLLKINIKELPQRACHNDTKLNNILFSKNNKALCLIDLDTIMKGSFLFDFGDSIRTIANTAAEDEKDLSLINFNDALFEAFMDGLKVNGGFLSKKEKELLPLGVVLMPFLHGIRALTDYLENNKYYKVTYETQNLDRCFSLFAFAKLALDKQDYMQKIILKKLNK